MRSSTSSAETRSGTPRTSGGAALGTPLARTRRSVLEDPEGELCDDAEAQLVVVPLHRSLLVLDDDGDRVQGQHGGRQAAPSHKVRRSRSPWRASAEALRLEGVVGIAHQGAQVLDVLAVV